MGSGFSSSGSHLRLQELYQLSHLPGPPKPPFQGAEPQTPALDMTAKGKAFLLTRQKTKSKPKESGIRGNENQWSLAGADNLSANSREETQSEF